MEIKLFTGLIDALGKVADGLKAIVKLPKGERETIRKTLDETNRLVDTTLNMVIIRLGDTLPRGRRRLPARGCPAGQLQRMDTSRARVPAMPQPTRGPARDADAGWQADRSREYEGLGRLAASDAEHPRHRR